MIPPNSLTKRYAPSSALLPALFTSQGEYCFGPGRESGYGIFVAATTVACVGFALQLIAGVICLRALWLSKRKTKSSLTSYLIFHTSALGILNLVGLVTAILAFRWFFVPIKDIWTMRKCFLTHTNKFQLYSGDQILWEANRLYARLHVLAPISNFAFGISGLLTDAMLIWRCRQIWKFTLHPRPNLVVLVPTLFFIGSIAPLGLSCTTGLTSDVFTLSYFAVTLALNIILTSLIVFRLWQCKVQLRKTLGDGHGKHYNILSIVFVESAFMNAVCSILLLASSLYGTISTTSYTMASLLDVWVAVTPAIQACSNYLIIYRGTQGSYGSWSNNVTVTNQSTAVFATSSEYRECETTSIED